MHDFFRVLHTKGIQVAIEDIFFKVIEPVYFVQESPNMLGIDGFKFPRRIDREDCHTDDVAILTYPIDHRENQPKYSL